jgi:hypothetical protein
MKINHCEAQTLTSALPRLYFINQDIVEMGVLVPSNIRNIRHTFAVPN